MRDLPAERLSALIGAIYDCAMAPERWPDAIRLVCEALDCVTGRLFVADLAAQRLRFGSSWNEPAGAAEVLGSRFGAEVTAAMQAAVGAPGHDPDMPFVLSRSPGGLDFLDSQVTREWATPLGWCDAMNAVLLRDGPRLGVFSAVRHRDVGIATEGEIALMRLLSPHLRRAVAIGDLLDMRALEADALNEAMDGLAIGVGVVAADGAILHANAAARAMMADADGPIRSKGGRLAARRPEATEELLAAVGAAQQDETRLGRQGIGVVLGSPARAEKPAVAHVLPLTGGRLRPGLVPRAAAAVFVAPPSGGTRLETVARTFGLTPAETRVVERLMTGETLVQAARSLGIAETTAKTHLSRILAKAGVARQAELLALVARLAPPVEG